MRNKITIEESWYQSLKNEFERPYFLALRKFITDQYRTDTIYPAGSKIFEAFNASPLSHTQVVILGQDPYHGAGQADGLAFSVEEGTPWPPSLLNILKEIKADLNLTHMPSGDLTRWAKQGVLLLNTTLTVQAGRPGSHHGKGWELFTDRVIQILNEQQNLVFLLWGRHARRKSRWIDPGRHLILQAAHPSPLSAHRGFFGCKHFSQANHYLRTHQKRTIDWSLPK